MDPYAAEVLWIIIVGFIMAFVLAFGIGANDVANSFGTSVGSKVLSVRQACVLATIFEIAGAILIGSKVSDTMRKGILDVEMYVGGEEELMLGCLSSLAGSAVWLIVATFFKLPISGTHSIVGATIGFSLVARGTAGLHWTTLGTIVASWFISPVLSGVMSVVLYMLIRRFILRAEEPLKPGLRSLPFFYGITVLINVFSVVHEGPSMLYFHYIPWWGAIIISLSIGVIVMLVVQFFLVPYQKKKIVGGRWYDALQPALAVPGADVYGLCVTEQLRRNKGTGVSFSFGDSTGVYVVSGDYNLESSRDPTPKPSRAMSAEDLKKVLPMITETSSELEKSNQVVAGGDSEVIVPVNGSAANGLTNPLAPQTNAANTKSNGFLLAETALTNSIVKDGKSPQCVVASLPANGSAVAAQQRHLHPEAVIPPASGQVTPAFGLSPNSSAVPLIKERTPEPINKDPEVGVLELEEGPKDDPPEVSRLFSFLQVLTATFGSFAHGGNDVSNAIGPLIALWLIYKDGTVAQKSESPLLILFYGGVGISIGLWIWGRRVIQTIGEDLTKITPSTGFTIEIGAAFTVLLASKIGLPISTTHCKVGSVVFVGMTSSSKGGVDWKLFRNIIFAWVFTLPVAAGLSALIMYVLQQAVL